MADPSNGQAPAWPLEAAGAADLAQRVRSWLAEAATAADLRSGLFGGFGAVGVVPEAWKWPRHAQGSILRSWRPFWIHFAPFSQIQSQTAYLRLDHCDIATIETSET